LFFICHDHDGGGRVLFPEPSQGFDGRFVGGVKRFDVDEQGVHLVVGGYGWGK